jgi:hypothetical protein
MHVEVKIVNCVNIKWGRADDKAVCVITTR